MEKTGRLLLALSKVLLALSVTVFALGVMEECVLPHLISCISSCYFVHFVAHGWAILKGKDHHHDGC